MLMYTWGVARPRTNGPVKMSSRLQSHTQLCACSARWLAPPSPPACIQPPPPSVSSLPSTAWLSDDLPTRNPDHCCQALTLCPPSLLFCRTWKSCLRRSYASAKRPVLGQLLRPRARSDCGTPGPLSPAPWAGCKHWTMSPPPSSV